VDDDPGSQLGGTLDDSRSNWSIDSSYLGYGPGLSEQGLKQSDFRLAVVGRAYKIVYVGPDQRGKHRLVK
jgi:hypothetical protein